MSWWENTGLHTGLQIENELVVLLISPYLGSMGATPFHHEYVLGIGGFGLLSLLENFGIRLRHHFIVSNHIV
jgi:hypothetical protein